MHQHVSWRWLGGLAVAAALWLSGCEEQVKQVKNTAQQVTNDAVEEVKQRTQMAGNVEVQLDTPVKTRGCYVTWLAQPGSRPAVLQVTSYNSPTGESFPSFFLRAVVTQKSPAELVNQKIPVRVAIQESPSSPIWHTPDDESGELVVSTCDEYLLSGQLTAVLINSQTGLRRQVTTKIEGELTKP